MFEKRRDSRGKGRFDATVVTDGQRTINCGSHDAMLWRTQQAAVVWIVEIATEVTDLSAVITRWKKVSNLQSAGDLALVPKRQEPHRPAAPFPDHATACTDHLPPY